MGFYYNREQGIVFELPEFAASLWCKWFHRKFWDYITYSGPNFHHGYVCSKCESFHPEYLQ